MNDDPNKLYLGFYSEVIAPLERKQRDTLRSDLEQQKKLLNDALAEGWRVVNFDYTVLVEQGGYIILVGLEKK